MREGGGRAIAMAVLLRYILCINRVIRNFLIVIETFLFVKKISKIDTLDYVFNFYFLGKYGSTVCLREAGGGKVIMAPISCQISGLDPANSASVQTLDSVILIFIKKS